jgi:hypothetical protein
MSDLPPRKMGSEDATERGSEMGVTKKGNVSNRIDLRLTLSQSMTDAERATLQGAVQQLLADSGAKPTSVLVSDGSTELLIQWDWVTATGAVATAGAAILATAFLKEIGKSVATRIMNRFRPSEEEVTQELIPAPSWEPPQQSKLPAAAVESFREKLLETINRTPLGHALDASATITLTRRESTHDLATDEIHILEQVIRIANGDIDITEDIKTVINASHQDKKLDG